MPLDRRGAFAINGSLLQVLYRAKVVARAMFLQERSTDRESVGGKVTALDRRGAFAINGSLLQGAAPGCGGREGDVLAGAIH